jgi:hypothetical protein
MLRAGRNSDMAGTRKRSGKPGLATRAIFLVTLALCATVAAQGTRILKPAHSTGRWQERVPVSGGIRVGVVVWQPGRFNPRELLLILPDLATRPRQLCVEISSRDGRYSAQLDYLIANEPPGPIRAVVDAEDLDKVNTAAGEDVAVLASLSNDCRAETPSVYLVAAWRLPTNREPIAVLLNSRVPTTIVGAGASVPCTELTGVTTAYNLRCELPPQWANGEVRLGISQKRGRGEVIVPLPLYVAR